MGGKIVLKEIRFGIIKLAFGDPNFPHRKFVLCNTGVIEFHGLTNIASGCELVVRGKLSLVKNFSCSGGTKIDAKSNSSFGTNVLIGHQCVFIDQSKLLNTILNGNINEK